jgi:hypothetical protein
MGGSKRISAAALVATLVVALAACDNSPWSKGAGSSNTIYSAMIENTPRHLDPTASYWSNDTLVTYQVYEPPYGYHYLKRPFELVPKSAEKVVAPIYLDKNGARLPDDAPGTLVAESVYDVPIKKGILYQPHPAFAVDEKGRYRYHELKAGDIGERRTPARANWWPRISCMPSSATPPRASRRRSMASSPSTCLA